MYVDCKRDITVGQLNGYKISLKSEEGNITLDKFHGESVKISTKTGDIKFKNVVQASNIEAVVSETGVSYNLNKNIEFLFVILWVSTA